MPIYLFILAQEIVCRVTKVVNKVRSDVVHIDFLENFFPKIKKILSLNIKNVFIKFTKLYRFTKTCPQSFTKLQNNAAPTTANNHSQQLVLTSYKNELAPGCLILIVIVCQLQKLKNYIPL